MAILHGNLEFQKLRKAVYKNGVYDPEAQRKMLEWVEANAAKERVAQAARIQRKKDREMATVQGDSK